MWIRNRWEDSYVGLWLQHSENPESSGRAPPPLVLHQIAPALSSMYSLLSPRLPLSLHLPLLPSSLLPYFSLSSLFSSSFSFTFSFSSSSSSFLLLSISPSFLSPPLTLNSPIFYDKYRQSEQGLALCIHPFSHNSLQCLFERGTYGDTPLSGKVQIPRVPGQEKPSDEWCFIISSKTK